MHSVNEKLFKLLLSDKRDFLSFENNFYRTAMIPILKETFLTSSSRYFKESVCFYFA